MPTPGDSEEQGSRARIDRHRAALVAEATAVSRERPELRIVGMVVEPDARESELFRKLLPSDRRQASAGFVGIVERSIALQLLGAFAPALLDWIESEGRAKERRLPVIYLARTGMRTAAFPWPASG
jgi:hypothetical protein